MRSFASMFGLNSMLYPRLNFRLAYTSHDVENARREGYHDGSGGTVLIAAIVAATVGMVAGIEETKQKQHKQLSTSPTYQNAITTAEANLPSVNQALIEETREKAIDNFTRGIAMFPSEMTRKWRSKFKVALPPHANPDVETLHQFAVEHVAEKSYDAFTAAQLKKIKEGIYADFNESKRVAYDALNQQTESTRQIAMNEMISLYAECAQKPRKIPLFKDFRTSLCVRGVTAVKRTAFCKALDLKLPVPTDDNATKAKLMLFGQSESRKTYPNDAYAAVVASAKSLLKP